MRFLILVILTGLLFTACKEETAKKVEIPHLLVTSPAEKDTTIFKDYVCQINSINHIEIRSQEKGYLQKIYIDEGQFVKKGQLMFKIMPLIYEAEMEKAKANLNFAEIEYQNTLLLADKNIVSKNELALSKAKLDKEKAELSLAQVHLGFTEIKAPFDGIMGRFHNQLGSLIDEGELLTELSDNSKMWAYFNVPEAEYLDYAAKAKSKTPVSVKLQMANGKVFDQPGIIETIEGDFNNETGNIAFRATFANPQRVLRHSETGTILMPVALKNALFIPQKATFEILDKKYVYVMDENEVLKATEITIGTELPHIYIVTGGITSKDKILMEGLGKVKNNEKIESEFVPFEKVLSDLNKLHAE